MNVSTDGSTLCCFLAFIWLSVSVADLEPLVHDLPRGIEDAVLLSCRYVRAGLVLRIILEVPMKMFLENLKFSKTYLSY